MALSVIMTIINSIQRAHSYLVSFVCFFFFSWLFVYFFLFYFFLLFVTYSFSFFFLSFHNHGISSLTPRHIHFFFFFFLFFVCFFLFVCEREYSCRGVLTFKFTSPNSTHPPFVVSFYFLVVPFDI